MSVEASRVDRGGVAHSPARPQLSPELSPELSLVARTVLQPG